ncbi:hypothetical protein WKR88_16365 [Trinickia caryophylli]|uniref:Uncharacterized protein n=1 Tax=Trinickia caryophylli TaxID=28094 RepID=A0A1X7GG64_TRICW|nr:hypothetical protein [Trinickia caryophylli]WQE15500.1 hypothetical protein U0034_23545 [Trinickia caryophylli]GLU33753.1 hypothetical protein Busp01_35950 [Trinickia caryophylli]SMF69206.1 hypothetical protein SAMN06295900_115143 [Trinickia caryophylli]
MPANILNLPAYAVLAVEHDAVRRNGHVAAVPRRRARGAAAGDYESTTPDEAYEAFGNWYKSIPHGLHGHFEPLTKAFQNWMP